MQIYKIPFFILMSSLMLISTAHLALADVVEYRCEKQTGCIDERINFGAIQIKCTDVNGDVLSDWVCEYELDYSCKNVLTGEVRKGGFDPLSNSLCNKLCGPCRQGWNKN